MAGAAGAVGIAGANAGGAAGDTSSGGAAGGEQGASGGAGGTPAAGAGGAGGANPLASKPGDVDCESAPALGAHRFCTDFSPSPPGWSSASCSVGAVEDGNVLWRYEQSADTTCDSYVDVTFGGPTAKVDLSVWVRVSAVGFADPELQIVSARVGAGSGVEGAIVIRPALDASGVVAGVDYFVGPSGDTSKRASIATAPIGAWRHLRLSAAATGVLTASASASSAAPTSGLASISVASVPAGESGKVELSFRQKAFGTAATRIDIDELIVDVTAP